MFAEGRRLIPPGRFLIVVWDGGGNVSPAIGIGQQLAQRGHDVRVLAERTLRARVGAAGLRFRGFERAPEWGSHRERALDWAHLKKLWFGPGVARDLQMELGQEPADVLVVDYALFGGLAAAEASGLPTAGVMHTLYHLNREGAWSLTWWPDGLPAINQTRRDLGLAPIKSAPELWDALAVVLAMMPQAFDRPVTHLPNNVHYVGPVVGPRRPEAAWDLPWPPDHPEPLVLVSFSTTYQNQEGALQRVIDALAALPVRGLVSAGPAVGAAALKTPANVVVRTYVDHDTVMPRAAVVVTHAGLSTVMAALSHGIPLLCMPMGRDQDFNTERVEAVGAGRMISRNAEAPEVRTALVNVLESPDYRRGARRMAAIIEREANGFRAITLLERLLSQSS